VHHLPVLDLFDLIPIRGGADWDEQLSGLNPAASYTVVSETSMVMRQPNGLRARGPKTWSWTHGTTRRPSDERVNIPQTAP
jgi:hypothetical protein